MNVHAILEESGMLAGGIDPRETDLFRRSRELGLVAVPAAGTSKPEAQPVVSGIERMFHVSGLWCGSCAWLIEHTLRKQTGVLRAELYFTSDLLKVEYEPQRFNVARVPELLEKLGYRATEYDDESNHVQTERKDLLLRLGLAAFFWLNVMVMNLAVYLGAFDTMPPQVRRWLPVMAMLLTLPVIVYSARPVLRLAWFGLRHGAIRMEALLSLGILTAFGYSTYEGLSGGTHVYFDIACAITTLVLLGKSIEQGAKHRAAETITALHRMLPKKARLANERFVAVESLHTGDRFLVKAGERIPADGVVVEGESQADESLLTGESAPVAKQPGAMVVAGSLNLVGILVIAATTTGKDSTIAQIVAAVERAVASRSDIERKVDQASRIFVPAVIAIAVLVAVGCILSGLPAGESVLRAITVLVIACPCALGIATPLALHAAVGAASRLGVLVRDARVLESIRRIDAVVLDKTGTLTEDSFSLLQCCEADLPELAALEIYSEHPLGQSVVRAAHERGIHLEPATGVEVRKGEGIRGIVNGQAIAIGSWRLFDAIPKPLLEAAHVYEEQGRTVAYYSIDGELSDSLLVFGSRLRDDAKQLVAGLRQRGVRVLLVSGDAQRTTETVAKQLGVEEFLAAVPPDEKTHVVEDLKAAGHTVAMIGDGVNDAPALAHAHLGVAMGSGADLAMRAASMVLLNGQLTRVLDVLDLSRRTHQVVLQNLGWAFGYNTLGIALAAMGWLNPIVAAGAMVASSLSVVWNSYRLTRVTPTTATKADRTASPD
jgi:heavy metal translocating P-type ATPase